MCSVKILEQKTVQIVKNMFSWKAFDVTLMDRYFSENEVDVNLVFSIHYYIYENIGSDTFVFSDVFEYEFEKIVDIFKSLYFTLFIVHSSKFEIDVMDQKSPIKFEDSFVQKAFLMWVKWEC